MPKSTKFSLLPLAVAVTSLMLSACGGGSFNNPSTIVIGQSKMIEKSDQSKDASAAKDDDNANADTKNKADSRLTMPVLGSVLAIPKRNQAYDKKKLTHLEEHVPLDENNITTAHTNPLPALTKELQERYEGGKIYQSDDKYKFVKAGWIFTGLYFGEPVITDENTDQPKQYTKGDGYLYYYGDNPTTGLAKGVANYTGHWDFVTDVKRERESTITETTGRQAFGGGSGYKMDSGFGDEVGATSFAEQVFGQYAPRQGNHRAVFKADFDAKKLTGTLSTKQKAIASSPETYVDRYDIDATIKGNRFAGSAIAKNTKSSFLEPNFFNKNADNRLEGGFYGENAEELAGKFLTNDNSVFAVFAGKQDNPEKVEKLEQVFGGSYVELTQDKAVNPAQKSQVLSLVNFGNVDQLQLGDHTITLLPQEAGKTTQQSVKLPTGQTAVITSFGSSDGVLRLGSVSKTAKPGAEQNGKIAENAETTNKSGVISKSTKPTKDQIEFAKQKLTEKVERLKKDLSDLIATYPNSKDKSALKKQITDKVLAGYVDVKEREYAEDDLKELLNALDVAEERANATEDILNILITGDKYKTDNEDNLKEFLVQSPLVQSTTNHTQEQLAIARDKLKAQLETEKQDLEELLATFVIGNEILGDEDGEEIDAKELDKLKAQIIDKIKNAYTEDKRTEVEKQAKLLIEQLKAEDEETTAKLVEFLAKGDKFDGENMANLTAYLPQNNSSSQAGFGLIGIEESLTGLYLLGERTPVSQVPVQGQANYQGTWHGRIGHHWQSQAGYGEYDGKAKFEVDFGTKQLTGTLTEKSGIEPAFNLKATINGNGFSGTATSRSNGIYLDEGRQQNQQILTVESNNLTGAFYGENAKHLGGSFSFEKTLNDDETVVGGAVFYGTRTKE
ncbi:transferrin-binding protein-like solute binding protein [Moraxella bovis]|uniref:transferrin-binding protein-like solute binding protein n=1 Tax=Moraxella bovis TaxID=476 RepID=UPI0022262772|nr:transferrin-binding protein-like solute binding protein [Moraxella bovis]UYZ70333.1 transferrin-binding protein-like solute binding protein [Moraxella bovis]WAJ74208.1 transferrin-binding protein-like solute binding protein [Moraxella bovis]